MSIYTILTPRITVLLIAAFNVYDVFATKYLIGDNFIFEMNPIIQWVLREYGYAGLALVKCSILLIIWFCINRSENFKQYYHKLLIGTCVLYGALAVYQTIFIIEMM